MTNCGRPCGNGCGNGTGRFTRVLLFEKAVVPGQRNRRKMEHKTKRKRAGESRARHWHGDLKLAIVVR